MQPRIFRCLVFAATVLLGWGSGAFAQYQPTGVSLQAAQEKVRRAEANVARFETDAKHRLQQSPEWIAAQRDADSATQDMEKARSAALTAVRASQPYADARATIEQSEKVIADGNRGRASARQVTQATNNAIDARLAISRMETDALNKSTEFRRAQSLASTAGARLDEMWQSAKRDDLEPNRAYRAAVAAKDSAELELKTAQESLRLARQQMAIQQQASRPQRTMTRTSRSSGRRSGGGGRY